MCISKSYIHWLKLAVIMAFFIPASGPVQAQCPTAQFSGASVCSPGPMLLQNQSSGSISDEWDFCAGELGGAFSASLDLTLTAAASNALWTSEAFSDGTVRLFAVSRLNGDLFRADYTTGIDSAPVSAGRIFSLSSLGTTISGLHIFQFGNTYHAFVTSGGSSVLGRLNFGNSLSNVPSLSTIALPAGTLSSPRNVRLLQENGNYILAVANNTNGGSVTLINFGSNPLGPPQNTISLAGFPAGGGFWGLDIARDCDRWFGVLTAPVNNLVYSLDLGNVLYDTIFGFSIATSTFFSPHQVVLKRENNEFKALVALDPTAGFRLGYLNYGSSFNPSSAPVAINLPQVGGRSRSLSLVNINSRWYGLYANYTGPSANKITFTDTCRALPSNTFSGSIPPAVTYASAGNYRVSLSLVSSTGATAGRSEPVSFSVQPDGGFTTTGSCSGSAVVFTDSSTFGSGSPGSFLWDFGNGNSGSGARVSNVYTNGGSYSVRLIVQNAAGCRDTVQRAVSINAAPEAAFSAIPVCAGSPSRFINSSSSASPLVSTLWSFGNGFGDSTFAPSFVYTSGGNYPVQLIVQNSLGCSDTALANVSVLSRPTAAFNIQNDCFGETSVFLNQSTMAAPDSISGYEWNLGDGTLTSAVQPSHLYGASGSYPVQLLAMGSNGCNDTLDRLVRIGLPPVPDFNFNRACAGQAVQFTDASSFTLPDSISRRQWDFGNGDSSSLLNPSVIFSSAGNYTVRLCVFAGSSCDSCISKTVQVLPAPQLSMVSDTGCVQSPLNFVANGSAPFPQQIISYNWNFNNGEGSGSGNSQTFAFASGGRLPVQVSLLTDSGCIVRLTDTALVFNLPVADFSIQAGCGSNTTGFTDRSVAGAGDSLIAWQWFFGDGGVSNQQNPVYTYPTTGPFQVRLLVTSRQGCFASDTANAGSLQAQIGLTDSLCKGRTVSFTDLSTGLTAEDWDFCAGELHLNNPLTTDSIGVLSGSFWDMQVAQDGNNWFVFGVNRLNSNIQRLLLGSNPDGNIQSSVNLGNPGNRLSGANGLLIVKNPADSNWYLLVNNNTSNTISVFTTGSSLAGNLVFVQTVAGPSGTLAGPRFMDLVSDGNDLILAVANSTNSTIALMNFRGDLRNPIGNADTLVISGFSGNPILWSVALVKDCENWFAVAPSQGGAVYRIDLGRILMDQQYSINVLGANINTGYKTRIVSENAEFKCFVVSENLGRIFLLNFGSSMSSNPTLTFQPLAGTRALGIMRNGSSWRIFSVSSSRGVINRTFFPDPCISVPAIAGAVSNTGTAYQTSGIFRVSLKAVSPTGAIRYTSRPISVIAGPSSRFGIQNPCFGSPTLFLDSSSISNGFISSWSWDFGNGAGSVLRNPQFSYPDTGRYNIRLITTGNTGCADTLVKTQFITEKPQAAFSFRNGCQRDSAVFSDRSVFRFDPIVQWRWTLGNNLNSNLQNPVLFPDTFGSVPVVLRVTNSGGCTDSASQNMILPAKPSVSWIARNTCLGDSVRFSNSSSTPGSSIVSNFWLLGDGSNTTDFSPTYAYPDTGTYVVFYQATAANGCTDSIRKTIVVSTPPSPRFSAGLSCQGSNTVFTDLSQPGSRPTNRWFWQFGDGQTDTLPSPVHVYQNPGSYTVQVRLSSPTDCSDSVSATVNVLPSPALSYSAGAACTGDSLTFVNSSSIPAPYQIVSWRWDLGNGDSSLLRDVIYRYDSAGFYNTSLTALSDSGCSASTGLLLRVGAVPRAGFLQGLSCALTATAFTDQSFIPPTDTINTWIWDFGNGSGSSVRNPSANYPAQGFYPVSLVVNTTAGCSDTLRDTVEVFGPLQAAIGVTGLCFGDSSRFEDLTASFSIVSRLWNFGDFSPPSAEASPNHFFTAPGSYAVTLSVQNAVGCQDTVTIPVTIQPSPTAAILAGTACLNQPVIFSSISQSQEPISRLLWSSEGNFYRGDSLILQFTDTGRREVRLALTTQSGCTDSTSVSFQVSAPPAASFSYNPLFGEAPLPVSFTNLSQGGNSFLWNFGEPNAFSTDVSPVYQYEQNGEFLVSLIAQSAAGCSDTFTETLRVFPTTLDLLLDDLSYTVAERNGVREIAYSVRLSNIGTRLIIQAKLQAETAAGGSIAESWNGLLYPGQTTFYQFNSSFLQSAQQGSGWLCVEAPEVNFGSDDINTANNAVCRTLDNRIQLIGPYPNPGLGGPVYLDIILPREESLKLGLFQAAGQEVAPLSELRLPEGKTSIRLPAESLRSGLYVLKIVFRDEILIRKLLIR